MNKKLLIALGVALVIGLGGLMAQNVLAAEKIGTFTARDGDIKEIVKIEGEVSKNQGQLITFKDGESGKEYTAGVGPSRYSGTYQSGDKITVEGAEALGKSQAGVNFKITKINDKVLREDFGSKPAWAGNGEGQNNGNGSSQKNGNFVDVNGDGICDNQ